METPGDSYQRRRMLKITKLEKELKKWDADYNKYDHEEPLLAEVLIDIYFLPFLKNDQNHFMISQLFNNCSKVLKVQS